VKKLLANAFDGHFARNLAGEGSAHSVGNCENDPIIVNGKLLGFDHELATFLLARPSAALADIQQQIVVLVAATYASNVGSGMDLDSEHIQNAAR
jgi:hypothetical protein